MEKDDKDAVIQKFKDQIADKKIPEHAAKVIDAELKRLEFLEPQSSEFQGNYLIIRLQVEPNLPTRIDWNR